MSALPAFAPSTISPSQLQPLGDAEFEFGQRDFERIRTLIYQRAGIHLQPGKQAMVYSRLARRLRDAGHSGFAPYLDALERASGPAADAEWQQFINSLTTNLTSFFREEHHFHLLGGDLQALRDAQGGGAPLRIWCNAASTGEEPYSIAMTVAETFGAQAAAAELLATDIDTQVLATAQRAVYGADSRGLSPERLKRHFLRGTGANAGSIRVRPELAARVRFAPFNLMNAPAQWATLGEPFHLIFCRNVMIYFDAATQRRLLERMHAVLRPGGLLYVGHSENFTDARQLFRLRGKTVYERV